MEPEEKVLPPAEAAVNALSWPATVMGNLCLVFGGLLFGGLAIVASWVPPRGDWVRPVARGWARVVLWGSGAKLVIENQGGIRADGTYVFLANHQSLLDIPAMILALPCQFRFLAARGLFKIPIFGWSLAAAGFVPVDRQRRDRARETLAAAIAAGERGASLIIYPEGTRSLDGRLQEFRPGGLLVALKTGVPLVPVGIEGTFSVRRKGSMRVHPGVCTVRLGKPLDAADFGIRGRRRLTATVVSEVARLAGVESSVEAAPAAAEPATMG